MARNKSSFGKANNYLTKAEKKRVQEGSAVGKGSAIYSGIKTYDVRTVDDTRGLAPRPRRCQVSSNNSWVHAVLFVVLVAIVISWALGY